MLSSVIAAIMPGTPQQLHERVADEGQQERMIATQGREGDRSRSGPVDQVRQEGQLATEETQRDQSRSARNERAVEERSAPPRHSYRFQSQKERGDYFKEKAMRWEEKFRRAEGSAQQTISEQQRAIASLQKEAHDLRNLLATRSQELDTAHTFMSTTDSVTEVEVKNTIAGINYECAQVAAALADHYHERPPISSTLVPEEPKNLVARVLGKYALHLLLQSEKSGDEVTSLEVLVQGCLAYAVDYTVPKWHFGPDGRRDQELFGELERNIGRHPRSVSLVEIDRLIFGLP